MNNGAGSSSHMMARLDTAVGGETPSSAAAAHQMNAYPAPQLPSFDPFPASLSLSEDVIPFRSTLEGREAGQSVSLEEKHQAPVLRSDNLLTFCSW